MRISLWYRPTHQRGCRWRTDRIRSVVVSYPTGRHFLQIPGPTNVPDRVLRAMAAPTIDHRGPAFQALTLEILELLGPAFATKGPVVVYPGSGTGGWEAALVNTLSPGDTVLAFETGHFATLWRGGAGPPRGVAGLRPPHSRAR